VKALTIWQPWASLCVSPRRDDPNRPVKEFETRGWSTYHRGVLAIHASRRWGRDQQLRSVCKPFPALLRELGFPESEYDDVGESLPLGAILGVVDLVECLFTSDGSARRLHPWIERVHPVEKMLGDFSPGRYGWRLANPRPLSEPIPALGMQGLWTLDDATAREIARRLGIDAEVLR
jgi:hypothetical protein